MFMSDKEILKFYIKHTKGYRLLYIGLIINDFIMSFEPLVYQKKKKWLIDTLSIDQQFSISNLKFILFFTKKTELSTKYILVLNTIKLFV